MSSLDLDAIAVEKFQDYLRIPTEQPKPDYEACKSFLICYAGEIGLEVWVNEVSSLCN